MRSLLIRRLRHIVQDRPLRFVRWADVRSCPPRTSIVQRLGSSIGSTRGAHTRPVFTAPESGCPI